MAAVSLQAPVALARLVDDLTPAGAKDLAWEPKWDGYRALVGGGRIFSRNGTNLTPLFPDLTPVLSARLPDDVVLDGEVIAWDTAAGRLDFEGLQAQMTAGRRIGAVAARRPAQLVVFDVLASGTEDLRRRRCGSGGPCSNRLCMGWRLPSCCASRPTTLSWPGSGSGR